MKFLKKRILVCFGLVSMIMVVGIAPVYASCHEDHYSILGIAINADSTRTVGYGTKGNLYI